MGEGHVVISAVVPVYNEATGLGELHSRLRGVLVGLGEAFEIVLVNDGSRDTSAEVLDALAMQDPALRVVHLSRNFGHQPAVAAGLAHTRGQAVVVLDADLQDPPELIPQLVAPWREGCQIVYARRMERRGEPVRKRLLAWAYYRVLRGLTDVDLPADTGDFCLMDRAVVDQLNRLPERNRYIRGLRAWVGYRHAAVPYTREPRFAGDVKYTFRSSLRLALNGILSFSAAPLRVATWLGMLISLGSFVLAFVFVILKLVIGYPVQGWASIVVIVLFLGGVQLLTIGVIGEYLSRIYDEVKNRPLYIVSRIVETERGSRD